MAFIQILDNGTIDKIAAGEVVERPSSVVKELVENALDAGASAVTVEIREGGISFIRVTDNGCGIEKDQVQKAFLRHATSKIRSVQDLESLQSLGFRGEALSSISAVSQVELITKPPSALTGVRYTMNGANAGTESAASIEEIGAPSGTTIMVRNLFFNTPVRRKFLKTTSTEGSYVTDLMEHLSLSRPDISFKYVLNGQTRFHTSGNSDLKEIIYRIYGRDIASELIPIRAENELFCLSGFLGKPSLSRANRNFEFYFVNGRYIKSSVISKGLEEGYREFLMQHKYPFAALHFTVPAGSMDVNVHPAKMEVRFTDPASFLNAVADAVTAAFLPQELIPSTPAIPAQDIVPEILSAKPSVPEPFEENRKQLNFVAETSEYAKKPVDSPKMQDLFQNTSDCSGPGRILQSKGPVYETFPENIHSNVIKSSEHILVEKASQMSLFEEKFLTPEARQNHIILGQVFDTYWLVAFQDKLFFVDQHAAHEKVKYEQLIKNLENGTVSSQTVQPAVVITLNAREEAVYLENAAAFVEMGFEVEAFGGNEYALRGIPTDLYGCDAKQLFLEILEELTDSAGRPGKSGSGTVISVREKIASMACKAAVKGNRPLHAEEMKELIGQLLSLDNPYHCPHGRPTIISMTKYEIDKKFKRIL